jgi:hypothetical protein
MNKENEYTEGMSKKILFDQIFLVAPQLRYEQSIIDLDIERLQYMYDVIRKIVT